MEMNVAGVHKDTSRVYLEICEFANPSSEPAEENGGMKGQKGQGERNSGSVVRWTKARVRGNEKEII